MAGIDGHRRQQRSTETYLGHHLHSHCTMVHQARTSRRFPHKLIQRRRLNVFVGFVGSLLPHSGAKSGLPILLPQALLAPRPRYSSLQAPVTVFPPSRYVPGIHPSSCGHGCQLPEAALKVITQCTTERDCLRCALDLQPSQASPIMHIYDSQGNSGS